MQRALDSRVLPRAGGNGSFRNGSRNGLSHKTQDSKHFSEARSRPSGGQNVRSPDNAKEALHESETRYRTLFDLVPTAVYTCDTEGLILEYNRRAVSLWRRKPKIRNRADRYCGSFKIFYPDGRPMPHKNCPMARVLRGENVAATEREILVECEDGTRRTVAVSPTALRDAKGRITGAINCLYDITEQKRVESELREKKNELDLIFEHTSFMMTRCSRDFTFQYVSRAYAKMVGVTPESVAGKKIVDVIGKKALAVIRPYIRKALAGQNLEYEELVPFKNGSRFLNVTYLPEKNGKGKVVGWIASLTDITERRVAERSLAEAVRQLSALYEFVRRRHEARKITEIYAAALEALMKTSVCDRAAVLLFDDQSVMRFVAWRGLSARFRKKVEGYSPWEPTERSPRPIYVEDFRQSDFPGKLIGELTICYDEPHCFDQDELDLALNIAGQLALAIERKQAETALLESEEIHGAFVRETEVGMARSDLKGHLVFVNKKLCEILGYDESELIGKFRNLIQKGKPYQIEKRYVRKDGSLVWVNVTASAIRDGAHGKIKAAVAVIRDITERHEAQLALQNANELLEKRVRERTRALVTTNRQLRKEISRRKGLEGEILEISEREQRQIGQELHDSVCQHLTAIAYMARSMAIRLKNHRVVDVVDIEKIAELINDGVTEARTIARGLHPVEMNPDGFTAALHSLLQQRSQLPYRLEIDDELSVPDPSVALHLYRIASEAIINANKHARASELVVRMRGSRNQITLSVTDDGVGIGHNHGKKAGMGFHVMEYRARSIGARLEITGIKPHGTRVSCSLPR